MSNPIDEAVERVHASLKIAQRAFRNLAVRVLELGPLADAPDFRERWAACIGSGLREVDEIPVADLRACARRRVLDVYAAPPADASEREVLEKVGNEAMREAMERYLARVINAES